ncbi:hypothetical protein M885DRAFT_617372 [Pelagophyceae sp. CCMP2097]|nr:hypothetical protein M885DRAFT_617372 [Pelagophyceae sp. CCMP2097]
MASPLPVPDLQGQPMDADAIAERSAGWSMARMTDPTSSPEGRVSARRVFLEVLEPWIVTVSASEAPAWDHDDAVWYRVEVSSDDGATSGTSRRRYREFKALNRALRGRGIATEAQFPAKLNAAAAVWAALSSATSPPDRAEALHLWLATVGAKRHDLDAQAHAVFTMFCGVVEPDIELVLARGDDDFLTKQNAELKRANWEKAGRLAIVEAAAAHLAAETADMARELQRARRALEQQMFDDAQCRCYLPQFMVASTTVNYVRC